MRLSKSFLKKSVKTVSIFYVAWLVFLGYPLSGLSPYRNDEYSRGLTERESVDNLVVYNAVGKRNNLVLIEHSRRTKFNQEEWDCVVFMYAFENEIPDDDKYLRKLIDEMGCSVPRTPGLMWGEFLQLLTPTFIDNYDYVAIVLDDMYMPDKNDRQFDPNRMLRDMEKHNIDVMSPGILNDSHSFREVAIKKGFDNCIVDSDMLETFVQIFTRNAWACFYKMLHHTGKRGWCYDVCFKEQCPDLTLAQDFSQLVLHVDRHITSIPPDEVKNITENQGLFGWQAEPRDNEKDYYVQGGMATCKKLGCNKFGPNANGRGFWIPQGMRKISCEAAEEDANEEDANEENANEESTNEDSNSESTNEEDANEERGNEDSNSENTNEEDANEWSANE